MDNNIVYSIVIIIFYFARALLLSLDNKNTSFLWISAYFVFIPFEFSKSITNYNPNVVFGPLGTTLKITMPMVMIAYILLFVKWKRKQLPTKVPDYFVWVVLAFVVLSLVNPFNVSRLASLIFLAFFISNIYLFYLFANFVTLPQIIRGIFDGMLLLCAVDFVLAICFPVLNMSFVTSLFHSSAEIWATREGTRVGAVGLFLHPGNLALFTVIASCFFMSCYFKDYKRRLSTLMLGANTLTIILTYSRTSYITYLVVMVFVAFVYKNATKNIFSPMRILKFVIPIALILYWLIFLSPFSDTFLQSDSETQYENRMVHYIMALQIFLKSPYIGVGLNSHLAYINTQPSITALDMTKAQFYISNPIHNSHLIILVENGILGFVLWWVFIFRNIGMAKLQIAKENNEIMTSTLIGILISYCIYGMSGWSPMSYSILPFLLFFVYFSNKFKVKDV